LVSIDGPRIVIRGCDILNGSPVYDLKPYIPQYDSFPEAKAGWVDALVNPGSDHRYRAGCSPEERAAKDADLP